MEFSYETDADRKVIIVTTSGDMETTALSEMCIMIRTMALAMGFKLLFDYSQSRNCISITEAYYWFSDYYDTIDIKLRHIPTAIVANKESLEFFQFYETTCSNKGIYIRCFMDEKLANEWLNKKKQYLFKNNHTHQYHFIDNKQCI